MVTDGVGALAWILYVTSVNNPNLGFQVPTSVLGSAFRAAMTVSSGEYGIRYVPLSCV
jgi:hypothetical protein